MVRSLLVVRNQNTTRRGTGNYTSKKDFSYHWCFKNKILKHIQRWIWHISIHHQRSALYVRNMQPEKKAHLTFKLGYFQNFHKSTIKKIKKDRHTCLCVCLCVWLCAVFWSTKLQDFVDSYRMSEVMHLKDICKKQ